MTLPEKKKRAAVVLQELRKLFPVAQTILRSSSELELLIAVILSAQTTDVQVNKVTEKLFIKYSSLEDYVQANASEFERGISSIGLYKGKARNILAMVKVLKEKYGGRVPGSIEALVELPGVGRKTANVVLGFIHGVVEGIAVDTHVTRLAHKWGLTSSTDPKKIEQDLMEILPKREWHDFTLRVIDYGRKYSPARKVGDESDVISVALRKLLNCGEKKNGLV